LLFIHGFGTDQNAWSRMYPRFAASYRIVLLDNYSAGTFDASAADSIPSRYSTLRGYADDVIDIILETSVDRFMALVMPFAGWRTSLRSGSPIGWGRYAPECASNRGF
jgi:pimeloyl-ACP methyl ester carboxylesterase